MKKIMLFSVNLILSILKQVKIGSILGERDAFMTARLKV